MAAAFAGGVSMSAGYLGLIIGALFAGLVYVIISLIVKFAGVKWIDKLMPAVVIGPTVAIIGLSLAGNAIGDLMKGNVTKTVTELVATIKEGSAVLETVDPLSCSARPISRLCADLSRSRSSSCARCTARRR